MKPANNPAGLVTTVAAYRAALARYRTHEREKADGVSHIVPEGLRVQFQRYLDLSNPSNLGSDGPLSLPVQPDSSLMQWGRQVEEDLNAMRSKTDSLRKAVYEALTAALYQLGATAVDWIAPRADLSLYEGVIEPAFTLATEYRKNNIDGIAVLTTDGPFVSGLSARLGIPASKIYNTPTNRVSAFEMAYWAVAENQMSSGMQAL